MGATPDLAWERALAHVDARDLQYAMAQLVKNRVAWAPTAMVDFMILIDDAQSARFGLPTETDALEAGRASDWSCPAVYEAACRVGLYRLTGGPMTAADHSPRFIGGEWPRAWGKIRREVIAGAVFHGPKRVRDPYAVALPKTVDLNADAKLEAQERGGFTDLMRRMGRTPRAGVKS